MSFPRACQQCRIAKAKCDLDSPACGRCQARGLKCSGSSPGIKTGLVFRDENETARRNSERARRVLPNHSSVPLILQASNSPDLMRPAFQVGPDVSLGQSYPWLNDRSLSQIPSVILRDIDTRAVERFFINWTLNPDNDGISPGHMSDLPFLYSKSSQNSMLWFAVRAVAFADMYRHSIGNYSFSNKALQHYGAALNRLRTLTQEKEWLSDDSVLAALLLIDNFESIYLGRTEPLGPHSTAITHVLHSRGDKQFYSRSNYHLWRAAYHRILARQILLREEPNHQQVVWLSKLNTNVIPLKISVDVQQMNRLAAAAKRITNNDSSSRILFPTKLTETRDLTLSILDLTASIQHWVSEVNEQWVPRILDPNNISQSADDIPLTMPIPPYTCPVVLDYHDLWLAYLWNMHGAAQIILRESLIEVIQQIRTQEGRELTADESQIIQGQRNALVELSCTIIKSFPQLMGFNLRQTNERYSLPNGMMIGRFFSLFSMSVVQSAQYVPTEYKNTASEVIRWIHSSHGLDRTT